MSKDTIPFLGNDQVRRELAVLLEERRAVTFVGAGASAGLYPMWNRFIELLAEHAVAAGKAETKDSNRWKKDTTSTPQQRVNTIVRKLGEPLYRDFLKATFGPTRGPDGKRYTRTHEALLRLPFRGYVTTNYDPALDFARAEVRPTSLSTGTPTWQDDDEVYRWRTGDIFQRDDCPMLWLHGYWQRPNGIVLNSGEYNQAYKPGIYRDTFKELWIREHLVFLGFSFSDPQFTFMVGEFLRDLADANAIPRHIAILGWTVPDGESAPDPEEIKEKRDSLEADYHVRALFYPVKSGDHSALHTLLLGLAAASGVTGAIKAGKTAAKVPDKTSPSPLPTEWVHSTSNDDKFTGRQDEIDRLDRWVRDGTCRIIGVCAVGGTGKTALAGHWLQNTAGWRSRPFEGLFAWSFYQNRNPEGFLLALLLWAHKIFGTLQPLKQTDILAAAACVLDERAVVLVLDGLEVLQEGPEDALYGAFLDTHLRALLQVLCEGTSSRSLVVLTSRFVFADLERYLGTTFRQLELPGLPPAQGAQLLHQLGVGGTAPDCEEVSRQLEGHPLTLRIFAESLPHIDRAQPLRFLDDAFKPNEIASGTPLSNKLHRLLGFYEKKFPPDHVRLLGIVALFRSPVSEETLVHLAGGLFPQTKIQAAANSAAISRALTLLNTRGILSREPIDRGYGYACHPILRDYFRARLLMTADAARRAAELLVGQPAKEHLQGVKQIEPVVLATELLIEGQEFKLAWSLFDSRLESGEVFKRLGAPVEGLRCVTSFVKDQQRRKLAEENTPGAAVFEVHRAIFASMLGQFEAALHYLDLSHSLRNRAHPLACLGRLDEAGKVSAEVVRSAPEDCDELYNDKAIDELANRGYGHHFARQLVWRRMEERAFERSADYAQGAHIATMQGGVTVSAQSFAISIALWKVATYSVFSSGLAIWYAELCVRTGHLQRAAACIEASLRECHEQGWIWHAAECHWILGWCALENGRLDSAKAELGQAEAILDRGRLLFELARLRLTAGMLALAQRDAPAAFHHAATALALAQPRGMKLIHADALVLRGRARLFEAHPDAGVRALDDANDALRLARDSGYAWAERDALFLEADAHTSLASACDYANPASTKHKRAADRVRTEAEAVAAKMVLTEDDLEKADRNADAWVAEWKRSKARRTENTTGNTSS